MSFPQSTILFSLDTNETLVSTYSELEVPVEGNLPSDGGREGGRDPTWLLNLVMLSMGILESLEYHA